MVIDQLVFGKWTIEIAFWPWQLPACGLGWEIWFGVRRFLLKEILFVESLICKVFFDAGVWVVAFGKGS